MLACNFQTDGQIETKTNRDRQSETRRHTGTYRQTETKTNRDRQSERQGDIQAHTGRDQDKQGQTVRETLSKRNTYD